ncbi:zinc finger protein 827-like isoform X2 [Megalops cyprinoides]|uniref:zinc finger protein 827-like isoform X2 n=1 Tax=Megalops cyprinoides TaxID=118141 RepID=UPI00186567D1|nr:zinc finger protein 827-like isoform X2 [Megalops cyprinoides]
MPRRKQEQPKRLPSHVDSGVEEGGVKAEPAEDDGWFGNASDTPSESSYGDDAPLEQDASAESSAGCPTPVPRASLELLGLDRDSFRAGALPAQDALSAVVSSLYGDTSQALGAPLSSNLRRLLEVRELAAQAKGGTSPPVHLSPSPSSSNHHAQQLSALARKLAAGTRSATPSPASGTPTATIKQEACDLFGGAASNGAVGGLVWAGGAEAWPPGSCPAPSSLSPDSAILKLKAAANAALQDKGSAAASSSSSSSSSLSSSSLATVTEGAGEEGAVRFDTFTSPFSTQSASSTLAALSKKVSERSLSPPAGAFLSLGSVASSAALLKEVAARAAGSLLVDKKEPPPVLTPTEDIKPLLDKSHNQALDLQPATTTTKAKANTCSQGVSPEEGGKPFQCPVCGLVIKRKSYWKRHMVIHTGVKSHKCPLCPFRCARKDNLKSHMKVHQHQDRGETFQCELCPFTSSRHFSLKLHMRCHQHCPHADVPVKDEAASDSEDEGGAPQGLEEAAGGRGSPGEAANRICVKEEPLERELSALSPFSLCRERPASDGGSPAPPAAAIFSPGMNAKTATDLLIKLSAANQKEALKGPVCVKEEPQAEGPAAGQPGYVLCQEGAEGRARHTQRGLLNSAMLSQDISNKVASELLMKLSEKKEASFQQATVKAEPMEVDPPEEPPPTPSHLLGFSTLPASACESDPLARFPEAVGCPQKALFCQDISVKMASELLFKLSERVSKANSLKDVGLLGANSSCRDERMGQSPCNSSSKACCSSRGAPNDSGSAGSDAGDQAARRTLEEQLYPCSVCGKVFGTQQTLRRHLSLHTEEKKYRCHLCPYTAKCRANLNQHITIHSAGPASADTEEDVTTATTERSQRNNCLYYYNCLVCGFQTELSAQFVSHMSLHRDREQWLISLCCTACDFVCSEEGEMKTHVSAGHAGLHPRSPLSETKSTSSSLSTLSDSVNSSEGSELLAPPSSTSSQSSSCSQLGSGAEEKVEKGAGGFECVFCAFACKTRSAYERHLQIHLIARMFECDVCHKFLKTPEELLEHKKCHAAPSGGLKCPLCMYSTSRPAALDSHLKTHCKAQFHCRIRQAVKPSQLELDRHVGERRPAGGRYRCEQCGHLSKTANKLAEHTRVHTGERPFHCDRCGYSCRRKDNLNVHKKLKHGLRQPLSCPQCTFSTAHPCAFSRHARKHREEGEGGLPGGGEGRRGGGLPGGASGARGGRSSGASSPLLGMSASLALRSVALSVTSRQRKSSPARCYLPANGCSPPPSPSPSPCERYRNCHLASLVPLTTLFGSARFGWNGTFHSHSPPFSGLHPASHSPPSPSLSPTSLKHSFLAYLGLTEKAETV